MKLATTFTLISFLVLFTTVNGQFLPVAPKVPNAIDDAMTAFAADAQLKNAAISFYVYDISRGTMVSEYNPNMSLPTASTMKLFTTATALEVLGSYHKFSTKIQYDGVLDTVTGVLRGNLYIKGGGDPTLGSRFYLNDTVDLMSDWVLAIQAAKIKTITGRIIGDASYFSDEYIPATWSWGDIGNYYGAGVSGLSIYDNVMKLWFDGSESSDDSTVVTCFEPYTPDVRIENRVRTGLITGDEVYMTGAPYDAYRIIKGKVPKGCKDLEVKVSCHEPDYIAAYELRHKLVSAGIEVQQQATTVRRMLIQGETITDKRTNVYEILSPAVSSIVYWTNLISNNLFAEHLLKHIGVAKYKDGSVYSSTTAVQNFWKSKGIDMTGFYMNDGCGLSRSNAASAKHFVDMLVHMSTKSKFWGSFESSLPTASKTGTMKNMGKGSKIAGNLKAKTGTMTRIKSFAGYYKSAAGTKMAFAIIVNNFNCSAEDVSKKIEKVMVTMGNFTE